MISDSVFRISHVVPGRTGTYSAQVINLDISAIRTTILKEVVMPKYLITLPKMPKEQIITS